MMGMWEPLIAPIHWGKLHFDKIHWHLMKALSSGNIFCCKILYNWMTNIVYCQTHRQNPYSKQVAKCPVFYVCAQTPKTYGNSVLKWQWCLNSITFLEVRLRFSPQQLKSSSIDSKILFPLTVTPVMSNFGPNETAPFPSFTQFFTISMQKIVGASGMRANVLVRAVLYNEQCMISMSFQLIVVHANVLRAINT